MKQFVPTLTFAFAACTSNPLEPGAGDQLGTGTNTLLVDAKIAAKPRVASARVPADFEIEVRAQLSLNGSPVSTGSVAIRSGSASIPLAWKDNGQGTGRWEGSSFGYDEVYQLDVTSGADSVTGVIVDGPDIHLITTPSAGAALDSTMPIMMAWDRQDNADEARVSTDGDGVVVPDTGSYTMSPRTIKADKDKAKTNTLRLIRTNRVSPAGAVGGSSVAVSVSNEIEVVAMPCPSC